MKCPQSDKICNMDETAQAKHRAECAVCRQQYAEEQLLRTALAAMNNLAAPPAISEKLNSLNAATAGKAFDCRATRNALEEWLAGELPAAPAFLLEEHLLSCASCSAELVIAETVQASLQILPQLEAPVAIADRVAVGRIPWWQRWLLPTPAFSPRLALAGSLAFGLLLMLGTILRTPQMSNSLQVANIPAITEQVAADINNIPIAENAVPATNKVVAQTVVSKPSRIVHNHIIHNRKPDHLKKIPGKAPLAVATVDNSTKDNNTDTVNNVPPRIPETTVVASARKHIENSMRLATLRDGDTRGYAASNLTDSGENATLVCSM